MRYRLANVYTGKNRAPYSNTAPLLDRSKYKGWAKMRGMAGIIHRLLLVVLGKSERKRIRHVELRPVY